MADESEQALPPSKPPVSPMHSSLEERNSNSEEESTRSPTPPSAQLDPSVVENTTMQSEEPAVSPQEAKSTEQSSEDRGNDEWIDILGSGDLLKKVLYQLTTQVHT